MKTKILFYIIVPLIILAVMMPLMLSCAQLGTYDCSEPEIPDNIPPIDNNAYNSVDVVYWNYYLKFKNGNSYIHGDTLKVYGWAGRNYNYHGTIYSNKNYNNKNATYKHLMLKWANGDIRQKILSIDISKKVFAKGIITVHGSGPCSNLPWVDITITDINDIYTE